VIQTGAMELAEAGSGSDQRADVGRWFAAIDHLQIGTGASSWIAQVVGIYVDGPDLWVQVSPTHAPVNTLVLRVSEASPIDAATMALRDGCRRPVARLQVIDLRPTRSPDARRD
jgi:hypothetical protein